MVITELSLKIDVKQKTDGLLFFPDNSLSFNFFVFPFYLISTSSWVSPASPFSGLYAPTKR